MTREVHIKADELVKEINELNYKLNILKDLNGTVQMYIVTSKMSIPEKTLISLQNYCDVVEAPDELKLDIINNVQANLSCKLEQLKTKYKNL